MFRPKLTKIPSNGPVARAIGQLNRAVSNQSNVRPGPGMGMSSGSFGNLINLNSPVLMLARSDGGIDAASDDDDGNRTAGAGDVFPVYLSLEGGKYVLKPDGNNKKTALNMALTKVEKSHYLIIANILDAWFVIWEECGS